MDLIAAALLLIFLLASTLGWAVIYSRRAVDENTLDDDLARTRLWASAVPLLLILLLIAVSFMALFSAHPLAGMDRLRYALGMWPTAVGLALCVIASIVPCARCVRAWRDSRWTTAARLHMSVFVLALMLVLVLLLRAGG